jgi:hypothetical protein
MRRLTRYSIRSLLVLVTLACLVLGCYITNKREYDRQQLALEQIESLLVEHTWKNRDPGELVRNAIARRIHGLKVEGIYPCLGLNDADLHYTDPRWLGRCLSWWDHAITLRVAHLNVTTGELGDEAIPYLARLKTLKTLTISRSWFTPEGEARLRSLLPETTMILTAPLRE